MANFLNNLQFNIAENGTTTLATAGKYCDRNIDVNVNVAGKPTQFTNLYTGATIHFKKAVNGSSSGITYVDDNYTNSILVPYHHKAGEPVVLRMRGIGTVRDRMGSGTLKADGTTRVNHYLINNTTFFTQSYDEYGDVTITFKGNPVSTEWYYFVFSFQYIGINSGATEAKEGPIITINEPIGNGGYV
jgi:hypothetical protein